MSYTRAKARIAKGTRLPAGPPLGCVQDLCRGPSEFLLIREADRGEEVAAYERKLKELFRKISKVDSSLEDGIRTHVKSMQERVLEYVARAQSQAGQGGRPEWGPYWGQQLMQSTASVVKQLNEEFFAPNTGQDFGFAGYANEFASLGAAIPDTATQSLGLVMPAMDPKLIQFAAHWSSDLVVGMSQAQASSLGKQIGLSISLGESPHQLMTRLQDPAQGGLPAGPWKSVQYRAEIVARTEIARIQAQAAEVRMAETNLFFPQLQMKKKFLVAHIHEWPCPRCAPFENRVFELDGRPYLPVDGPPGPALPAHPNCRCVYVPHIPDSALEKFHPPSPPAELAPPPPPPPPPDPLQEALVAAKADPSPANLKAVGSILRERAVANLPPGYRPVIEAGTEEEEEWKVSREEFLTARSAKIRVDAEQQALIRRRQDEVFPLEAAWDRASSEHSSHMEEFWRVRDQLTAAEEELAKAKRGKTAIKAKIKTLETTLEPLREKGARLLALTDQARDAYRLANEEVTNLLAANRKASSDAKKSLEEARNNLEVMQMRYFSRVYPRMRSAAQVRLKESVLLELGKVRELGIEHPLDLTVPGQNEDVVDSLRLVAQYIPKDWSSRVAGTATLQPDPNNLRAHFDMHNMSYNMHEGESMSTVLHELGHHLEEVIPELAKASQAFLAERTAGETAERLSEITGCSAYKNHEVTREDAFSNPYMGKNYVKGYPATEVYATEVMSMGLEGVFFSEHRMWQLDQDSIDFVIGALASL